MAKQLMNDWRKDRDEIERRMKFLEDRHQKSTRHLNELRVMIAVKEWKDKLHEAEELLREAVKNDPDRDINVWEEITGFLDSLEGDRLRRKKELDTYIQGRKGKDGGRGKSQTNPKASGNR